MKSLITILAEQKKFFYLTRRLAKYELKTKNESSYLGSLWEYLNPLIQILIYWFVFQNVMQRSSITMNNGEEVPFVFWLLVGFVIWIFFFKATIEGSKSIYSRLNMLSKMKFPMSIIPSFVTYSYFQIHLILLGITLVILNISGYFASIYYVQLLYLIPMTLLLIFALALVTSTLSTIIRDLHMLLNAVLKMVLYLSPVLWEIGRLADPWGFVAKINPLYYLIESYRAAVFGTEWYAIEHPIYTLYFVGFTGLILLIGSILHVKFRRHFVDFL